jgi:hypothetical protein
MRNKVFVIRGQHELAERITLGNYERIDVDRLVQIIALRDGHIIEAEEGEFPEVNRFDQQIGIGNFLQKLVEEDLQHILASEYADAITERGIDGIKAVEGFALIFDWVFETVKAFHKNHGQVCVEVKVFEPQGRLMSIDGQRREWREALSILNPNPPSLG